MAGGLDWDFCLVESGEQPCYVRQIRLPIALLMSRERTYIPKEKLPLVSNSTAPAGDWFCTRESAGILAK